MIYVPPNYDHLTDAIALQCNLVGVMKKGKNDNMVARVSIVNTYGDCIYNTFVSPTREVLDYRYKVNGITEYHLNNGKHIRDVRSVISYMIKDRILVGHNINRAMKNLGCGTSDKNIREITNYSLFQEDGGPRSLMSLSSEFLGTKISNRPHDSVIDAKTAMRLYIYQLINEDKYSEESESEYCEEEEEQNYYYSSSDD